MFEFDVTKWLPRFVLNDKNGYAVAKAIEAGVRIMNDTVAQGVKCITDIDEMPEWRLDELAWEMNCLYDYYADIEEKRKWIRNATPWYMAYGTRSAIEKLAGTIFGESRVGEWFEYGGQPFYFRVDIKDGMTEDNISRFLRMLQKVKNVRSVLERMEFRKECELKEYVSVACVQSTYMAIQCEKLNYARLYEFVGISHVAVPNIILT